MSTLWPYLLAPSATGDDSICAVSAAGHRITMADGRTILDGTSGLWNVNLGYGNPVIAEALAGAARDASYLSVFRFENAYARRAADQLIEVAGAEHYARAMFSTSGGAANDLMTKLARQYHLLRGNVGKNLIVSMENSYHGLTFGGFALTGEYLGQRVYGVDQRLIRHLPLNDPAALAELMEKEGDRVAAVLLEPVQGSGTVPASHDYLRALDEHRATHGFLLVADEVATGFGRTGPYFATHAWPVRPDVLLTSKGLTNGTCGAAAMLVSHGVSAAFDDHDAMLVHAETQGGTAITAAAVSATIGQMAELDAIARGHDVGAALRRRLEDLASSHDHVGGVTGLGCFQSITLLDTEGQPANGQAVADLVAAIRRAGAIVHPGPSAVQLIPSLTYSEAELDELVSIVADTLPLLGTRYEAAS